MLEPFDPSLIPVALLLWPAAKSVVLVGAAAVSLWSRQPSRRAEARRLIRMITRNGSAEDKTE